MYPLQATPAKTQIAGPAFINHKPVQRSTYRNRRVQANNLYFDRVLTSRLCTMLDSNIRCLGRSSDLVKWFDYSVRQNVDDENIGIKETRFQYDYELSLSTVYARRKISTEPEEPGESPSLPDGRRAVILPSHQ